MALAARREEIRARPLSDVLNSSSVRPVEQPRQAEVVRSSTVPVINIYNEAKVTTDNLNQIAETSPAVLDELKIPMTDRILLWGIWNGCLNGKVSTETVNKLQAKKAAETAVKLEKALAVLQKEKEGISRELDLVELQINALKADIQKTRLGPQQVAGVLRRKAEELVTKRMALETSEKAKAAEIESARNFLGKLKKTTSVVHEVMTEYSKSIKGFDVNGAMLRNDEAVDQYAVDVEQTTDLVDRLELISADPRKKRVFKDEVNEILGLATVSTRVAPPLAVVPPKPVLTELTDSHSEDGDDSPDGDLDTGMLLESSRAAKQNVKTEAKQLNAIVATL